MELEDISFMLELYKDIYKDIPKSALAASGIHTHEDFINFFAQIVPEFTWDLATRNLIREGQVIDMLEEMFPFQAETGVQSTGYSGFFGGVRYDWLDAMQYWDDEEEYNPTWYRGWHDGPPDFFNPPNKVSPPVWTFGPTSEFNLSTSGGLFPHPGEFLDMREWDKLVNINTIRAAMWMAGTPQEWEDRA